MLFTVYQASQSVRRAFHFSCQNSAFSNLGIGLFSTGKNIEWFVEDMVEIHSNSNIRSV